MYRDPRSPGVRLTDGDPETCGCPRADRRMDGTRLGVPVRTKRATRLTGPPPVGPRGLEDATMSMPPFDPEPYNAGQRQEWDAAANGWKKWGELIERYAQFVATAWWIWRTSSRDIASWTSRRARASPRSQQRVEWAPRATSPKPTCPPGCSRSPGNGPSVRTGERGIPRIRSGGARIPRGQFRCRPVPIWADVFTGSWGRSEADPRG